MAIKYPQGFMITSAEPIDARLVMTVAQMRSAGARMPDPYITICADGEDAGKIFIYRAINDIDSTYGKFRLLQYSDLGGAPVIPTMLSQLEGDSEHRTVTDSQISRWNSGSVEPGDDFITRDEFEEYKAAIQNKFDFEVMYYEYVVNTKEDDDGRPYPDVDDPIEKCVYVVRDYNNPRPNAYLEYLYIDDGSAIGKDNKWELIGGGTGGSGEGAVYAEQALTFSNGVANVPGAHIWGAQVLDSNNNVVYCDIEYADNYVTVRANGNPTGLKLRYIAKPAE